MTVTFKNAVVICFAAALHSSAVAPGQQAQSGDAPESETSDFDELLQRAREIVDGPTWLPTLPAQSPLAPDHLFANASPGVVKLTIKDDDDREIGVASGCIVRLEDVSGLAGLASLKYHLTIVTNYHVIRPAISIDVTFSDGSIREVRYVIAEERDVGNGFHPAESLRSLESLQLKEVFRAEAKGELATVFELERETVEGGR